MKIKLFKIPLIVLVFLGLVIAGVFLTQAENQVSANDSTTIREPLSEPAPLKFSIPGRIEETGAYFEIEDSEYLNITLKSTEEVKVALESIPRMISINLESSSTSSSTIFTLEGLEPNKTYYKYQDSYKNGAVFVSDENGSYSWTQDLSQPHHIWLQEIKGTVFLPEDCSTYGNWDETTQTCTLNQDLSQSVEITANNITLDCQNHNITGTGTSYGIYLNSKTGVTIKNCHISNFTAGMAVFYSSKITLSENNLNFSYYGLQGSGYPSSEIKITQNNLSNNSWNGLVFSGDEIDNSEISSNEISNNGFGGIHISGFSNTIQGNNISNNGTVGLRLYDLYNKVIQNNITSNGEYGILLEYAWQNTLTQNNVASNNKYGIRFYCSGSNTAFLNNFINHQQNYNWTTWEGCGTPPPNVLNSPEKLNYKYSNQIFNNYLGNHWSDYIGFDINNNGIGDISYYWGLDNYPLIQPIENYIILPANQPPIISNLNQYKSDSVASVSEGAITTELTVVFKTTLSDPDNDQIKLRIELKEFNQPFNGQNLLESEFLPSGSEVSITRANLVNGQYHWRARAVDSRGLASDWQEFGEIGNIDFEVKLVPLYTQIESDYPSRAETEWWSVQKYGTGNYPGCYSEKLKQSTISTCGCAITSEVMILRFHDVTTAMNGNDVNPLTFNNWLTNNNGYWPNGGVKWEKIQEYSRDEYGFARVIYDGPIAFKDNSTLDLYLNNLKPVILYETVILQGIPSSHFIVADGKLSTTYTVKDPAWYETKYLAQAAAPYIKNYNNNFYGLRLFSPALALKGVDSISINLASPAEILVIDSQERKLGRDPINNISYSEIPGGTYYQEGIGNPLAEVPAPTKESKFIWIPQPISGKYEINVIGIGTGSYTLEISAYDQNGNSEDIIYRGSTAINNVQPFELNYSKENIQETETYRIVNIDIKPGSYPNSINLKSRGVLPVAVLTDNFFDAKDIVVNSVLFAGAEPLRGNLEDVDKDGDSDLILHFNTQALQLTSSDTEAILTTRLKDNTLIKGTDSVRIVTNHKSQNSIFLALLNVPTSLYQQLEIFLQKFTLIWMKIWGFLSNYFNQLRGKHEEIGRDPCLTDNEWVDYKIDEKKNASSSAIISIKEKNTNKQIFEFLIDNIVPNHYYPYEAHKCGLYLVREFNVDYERGKPLADFRMEVWRYRYDGSGEKLAEENDFRVDPNEKYLTLERSYLGQPDYALVIKDLETKEDVFVLTLNEILEQYPNVQPGSFNLGIWTPDGKYLWGVLFVGAYNTAYYRIEAETWKTDILSPPSDLPSGAERDFNFKGWLAYVDITSFTGIKEVTEQIEEEARKEGKMKNLWIYNLFTKEKIKIASAVPEWRFNPKWFSDDELEYELPIGEKKIYKIEE